jgi:Protein of unknown function (DUF3667)
MTICKNCGNSIESKFCSECGTASEIKRINKKYVLHELQHGILHFESGFLYTVKQLILRPGQIIHNFIEGERSKLYKPIGFLIICSIIYTILAKFLHFKVKADSPIGNVNKIIIWISENTNYSNLIEIVFIALSLNWFFKKRGFNYFENIVLLSFLSGIAMLISSLILIISVLLRYENLKNFGQILIFVYMVWGIEQFYGGKNLKSYFKAFLAYFLGFTLFIFAAILLALVLKFFKVHL